MSYKHVRSLERGVAVLRFLNRTGAATARDIANHIELPRPTVYRILDTLVECGLIYRSPSAKVFRLAEAVSLLSGDAQLDRVSAATRAVLRAASADLSWPVFLSTLTEEGVVIRETTRGDSVFWTELGWIGSVAPVWEVPAGWVFGAFSTEERQAKLLAEAPAGAIERIRTIAAQGYAEERDALGRACGIAVPVGKEANLLGALAMVWNSETTSEAVMIDHSLAVLQDLSKRIVATIHSREAAG